MKYLWIGSYMTNDIATKLKKIGYRNPASVLSQRNILEGIEVVTGQVFDSIGVISTLGFPKQKVLYVHKEQFIHEEGAFDTLAGFINIQYVNKIASRFSLTRVAKRWAKQNMNSEVHIFVYEMRSACLAAAVEIKRIIPNSKIHLIVPDLPQFMDLQMNRLKRILKNIDWYSIQKQMCFVDDYVLYSSKMAEFLHLHGKRWMVMEGSINQNEIEEYGLNKKEDNDEKKHIIMYSGAVQSGFLIENLLKAFEYLDEGFELWITGRGTAVGTVQKYAEKDNRIKYYGFLPTREELKILQSKATMLINMRNPNEEASSYCFPSKLFEYMLTGKPVLSCRLKGIPEEYFEYLIEMKSMDSYEIARTIINTSQITDLSERGKRGREFIINEKNNIIQARKIMKFVEN